MSFKEKKFTGKSCQVETYKKTADFNYSGLCSIEIEEDFTVIGDPYKKTVIPTKDISMIHIENTDGVEE